MRTPIESSTASKCVTGIYTSNYNVTFYDMDYNNVPYTTEYAVKLTNQLVTGLSPTILITYNILLYYYYIIDFLEGSQSQGYIS